ncbi:MAG: RNA-binding S4 domain-containing protein [Burkholderiales bacterium]|nr:RNA-binding S4 domain-containing protein [Burkholderiales bacterium]MDE2277819.1 RNA-binding S4 domain-containing protein [Burkholderiales bacterium]
MTTADPPRLRLDKWLWAARLYKTRALAAADADRGRVCVNDQTAKPGRELRLGDRVGLRQGPIERVVVVRQLAALRGPAPVAQGLYEETPASLDARQRWAEQQRLAAGPGGVQPPPGRPTKRERRRLVDWQRWSASADEGA